MMDVVELIFGRLRVDLGHVWGVGTCHRSCGISLSFVSQVELFSTGNVDLRHQLDFDARQFVALLQLLGPGNA